MFECSMIFILQKKKNHILLFNLTCRSKSETAFGPSNLLIKNSIAPSGVLLLGLPRLLGPIRIEHDLNDLLKTLALLFTGHSRALVWS